LARLKGERENPEFLKIERRGSNRERFLKRRKKKQFSVISQHFVENIGREQGFLMFWGKKGLVQPSDFIWGFLNQPSQVRREL